MPSPSNTTIIDDFNRANGAVNAGAGAAIWTSLAVNGVAGSGIITSNQLGQNTGAVGELTSVTAGPDVDYQFQIPVIPTAGNYVAFWWDLINGGTATFTAYCLIWINGTGWQFRKYVSGSSTTLTTFVTPTPVNGDTVWVNMTGTTMTAYLDAGTTGTYALIGTRTDTSITPTVGPVAFELATGVARLDNFAGGSSLIAYPTINVRAEMRARR